MKGGLFSMANENSSPKTITGRPTKLTPEKQEEIIKYLRAGNYVETAAAYAGLSKASVYNWLRRGRREIERVEDDPKRKIRKEEQPYVDFLYAVEKAQAGAEMTSIALINRASEVQWQAAAWRLERKHPGRWGRSTVPDEEQKLRNEMLEMELELAKLKIKKAEELIKQDELGADVLDDGFLEALEGKAGDIWQEHNQDE